jgi:hypothetical protein
MRGEERSGAERKVRRKSNVLIVEFCHVSLHRKKERGPN